MQAGSTSKAFKDNIIGFSSYEADSGFYIRLSLSANSVGLITNHLGGIQNAHLKCGSEFKAFGHKKIL
jgi:hypothetical protein